MINFSEKYDRKKFQLFLKEFLPEDLFEKIEELQVDEGNQYFKKAVLLGSVKSLEELVIIEVERKKTEKSRITITKELFKFLNTYGYSKALVVTFSEKEPHYRFSLIKSDFNWSGTKVNKEFSNPKRLSFLLGEGSKIHTATKHLIKKGKISDFEDLHTRFNIEIINDEFYEHYKNLFLDLKDKLDGDKQFSSFAKKINLSNGDFAKRLLGQVIFCYFLQKKGWLGTNKNKSFVDGDSSFLRNKFEQYKKQNKNFFNNFLEFFFYQGLNNKNENNFVKQIDCKVPYIGGGLFEYYEGYDWKKENLNIPNSTFSNSNKNGILDIFELYNFTVDENENIDVEISIDPEMLGKTFEKLLDVKDRKSSGTFYTPREIVRFMSEDSLISYLNDSDLKLSSNTLIKKFVQLELLQEDAEKKEITKIADTLDKLLENIKVCDPAVGTGAFVVEMVNLVSKTRKKLDTYLGRSRNIYKLKLQAIQKSIYGVDIESQAIEIAKLRLWLALIIDETDYEKINALPNLDFKFIVGNSLYQSSQPDLFDYPIYEKIQSLKDEYLVTSSYLKQKKLSKEINELHQSLNQNQKSFNFMKNFSEVFNKKKKSFGFDIIIGNPPYVRGDNEKQNLEISNENLVYKKLYNEVYNGGRTDLYIFFIKKADEICKKNGVISFILSNKWMTANYGKKLRIYLSSKEIKKVVDFGDLPIFEAAVCPNILIFKNTPVSKKTKKPECLDASYKIKKLMKESNEIVTVKSLKKYLVNIENLFNKEKILINDFPRDGSSWSVSSDFNNLKLITSKKNLNSKIKDKNIPIRAGIKTGLNSAFIIDESTYKNWISEDLKCKFFLKPFLRGRNINPWEQNKIHDYLIYINRTTKIDQLPKLILNHLNLYKKKLTKRATVPESHTWYQLQQPQIGFTDDFENSYKLVWRDISNRGVTTIVNKGVYLDMTCFYIPIKDIALCSWMNSEFFIRHLRTVASSIKGDAVRWKKQWIEQIYYYPDALKKDLEKIYELSKKNSKDGAIKLNNLVNNFLE